jgi:FAD dependent oxidoreductase TIGR03364
MTYDVAVVGSGIVGLAHAYACAKRGLQVIVFDRSPAPQGASVRNFGMVWPVGQPPGELRELAMASRALWSEVLCSAGIWHLPCGSLHLAYAEDEMEVLQEFHDKYSDNGYSCRMLNPDGALEYSPVIKANGLKGALHSPDEICVNPRTTLATLLAYLSEAFGVVFEYGRSVVSVESGTVVAGGIAWKANHVFICTGDDFETLYPDLLAAQGMVRCRLQMLKAAPPDRHFRIGTHLCAGLTLAHYKNFRGLSSLPKLLDRFRSENPQQMKYGIHVLVSQHQDGALTIGDSHVYDNSVSPFSQTEIDDLIWNSLSRFLPVSELTVIERWHGVYAHHPSKAYIVENPEPKVTIVTGVGGAGMTLSFGLGEKVVREHISES